MIDSLEEQSFEMITPAYILQQYIVAVVAKVRNSVCPQYELSSKT